MVAPAEGRVGTWAEPPCPLPPELRSDIAYRRAHGHPWDAIGVSLWYDPDALRRATENDPDFAAAQERAWAEAAWEGQADGLRRLRQLANAEDDGRALKAAEILLKYAAERRRDEARLAVERLRAEAARARAARREAGEDEPEPGWAMPRPEPLPKTEAEWAVFREGKDTDAAARSVETPGAYMSPRTFLWGGKHPLGRSCPPDEADVPMRVRADHSIAGGVVYWVVPHDPPPAADPSHPVGWAPAG